jgi:hypothetical protein
LIDPIDAWKQDVQYEQIVIVDADVEGRQTIPDHVHRIRVLPQPLGQERRRDCFVLSNQKSHPA